MTRPLDSILLPRPLWAALLDALARSGIPEEYLEPFLNELGKAMVEQGLSPPPPEEEAKP